MCSAKRHVRFTSPAQLREDACDIPHAPMLDDLIVLHSENVTRSEAQRSTSRRDTKVYSLVSAGVYEARRDMVLVCDHNFG